MEKMESLQEKLVKIREERSAREKARLEKLRELNLKKYNKDEALKLPRNFSKFTSTSKSQIPTKAEGKVPPKPLAKSTDDVKKSEPSVQAVNSKLPQKKSMIFSETAGPSNANVAMSRKSIIPQKVESAPQLKTDFTKPQPKMTQNGLPAKPNPQSTKRSMMIPPKANINRLTAKHNPNLSKSIVPPKLMNNPNRKSIAPSKNDTRESVFDRLYKPKNVASSSTTHIHKTQTDSKLREKSKNSDLIYNKRRTMFETKMTEQQLVRRSFSAVHFKRIPKSELSNCIKKWSSSENLTDPNLKEVDEDDCVSEEKIVSAVKSDRKKVQFQTPNRNYNTPKPAELQSRLKNWLQKRGKSLDAYHHLQCFGLHNIAESAKDFKPYDDEDKENIAVESDSDNDSFCDNANNKASVDNDKWRRASCFDESQDTICSEEIHNTEDLLQGALRDLTELVKEGYDWEQSARWLRSIRSRHAAIEQSAAYWECRAALEEQRGNLPATLHCWEEALANGTKSSVVEASLDQLLDKFMQLKISPSSAKKNPAHSKMVDVKNVFKSTILRFAVQQAKMRQSNQHEAPHYTVTPVRRCSRLAESARKTPKGSRTPLVQLCASLKHIDASLAPVFVPNDTLPCTP